MNYIDKHIKTIYQDKTIGIIIVRKDDKFIIEYSSDSRIYTTNYLLVWKEWLDEKNNVKKMHITNSDKPV